MKTTKILSSFIVETDDADLTFNAIEEAKKCCVDGIGVLLAGSTDNAVHILKKYVISIGGKPQSSLICPGGFKTSAINAATVNGTSAHILDFDDTHRILGGHPTAVILPAVLSVGESVHATGKDVLTSLVIGIEVAGKIASAVNPRHYQSGYHVTSTIGVFGAVAAAARLLKLDTAEVQNALGIAGSMSSGLKENFGTMTKSLHAGLASSNAIKAALLAKNGFTATGGILEGPMGFCKVMCSGAEPDKIIQNLGNPWEIENPGITRKKYPCCARTHAAIDGILKIVQENDIDCSDLEQIVCSTDEAAFKVLVHPSPASELEAKFSMPFCISIAFLEKDVFIKHFHQQWLQNQAVAYVMGKVSHVADRSISDQGYENRWTSKVTIQLKSGKSYSELVKRPKGDPSNPFTFDDLREKFLQCSDGVLEPEVGESVLRRMKDLEGQEDISVMIDELCRGIITREEPVGNSS